MEKEFDNPIKIIRELESFVNEFDDVSTSNFGSNEMILECWKKNDLSSLRGEIFLILQKFFAEKWNR